MDPPGVVSGTERGPSEPVDDHPSSEPPPPHVRPGTEYWLRTALLYAVINLPLLFLFLDTYNLNGDIYSSSYLALGLNPYHAATNVGQGYLIIPGAGYFILPYNLIAFYSYPALGFNAIYAEALLKIVGLVAGFFAARIAFEIAFRERPSIARSVYLAVLFNPFIIFVNSVAGDADTLVVFLVFLAVFLFRYGWTPRANLPAVVLGTFAIAMTVLSYYFTLLLVPTLIAWIDGWRTRLTALALLAAGLVVLSIPVLVFGVGSVNTSSVVGTVQVTGYSFPYYLAPSQSNYLGQHQAEFSAAAAVFALVIPFLFRRWNVGEGPTLLTVLLVAFAFTFRLPADIFAVLAAFVPLALALRRSERPVSYWTCLLFSAFLVPIYLLVELFNGPGQVTGIYYWLYPYLHQNVILFVALGGSRIAQPLFALYLAGGGVTLGYLLWRERPSRTASPARTVVTARPFSVRRVTLRELVVVLGVAALLVVLPLAVAVSQPPPSSLETRAEFNSQLFFPYDIASPNLYPLAGPNTFSVDSGNGVVTFVPASPPIGFARNVASTSNVVELSVSVNGIGNRGPVPVWESNESAVIFSSMLSPVGGVPWNPTSTGGATPTSAWVPPMGGPMTVYGLAGQHALEYHESAANVSGREEFLAASEDSPSAIELWSVVLPDGEGVEGYLSGNVFYLGIEVGSGWKLAVLTTSVVPGQWFLAGFDFDSNDDSVTASINDANVTEMLSVPATGTYSVVVGAQNLTSNVSSPGSWTGNVTGLRSFPSGAPTYFPGFFVEASNLSRPVFVGNGSSEDIDYTSTTSGGSLRVGATNLSFSGTDSLIEFGKLGASAAAVVVQVLYTSFVRAEAGTDLGWVVAGFAVLLPAWVFAWGLWRLLRPGRQRRS